MNSNLFGIFISISIISLFIFLLGVFIDYHREGDFDILAFYFGISIGAIAEIIALIRILLLFVFVSKFSRLSKIRRELIPLSFTLTLNM